MSVFASVGIFLFSMLIMASLQLIPGVFAIFYHHLAGRTSKNRAQKTALFFTLGLETAVAALLVFLYLILNSSIWITEILNSRIFAWIMFGWFIALGVLFFCLYFRKSSGTELFIPRSFTRKYLARIRSIKTPSDAFYLGFASIIPEFFFTLPVLFVSIISVMRLGEFCLARAVLIILFVLASILPIIILHSAFNFNINLADFLKFRFKNKLFFRVFISLSYLAIATFILMEAIL